MSLTKTTQNASIGNVKAGDGALSPSLAGAATSAPVVSKKGFLTKQGNRYKSWKLRWFELNDQTLSYFKDKEAAVNKHHPYGTIILSTCEVVVDGYDHTHTANSLSLVTSERTYFMIAQSPQDRDDWIIVLREAIKGMSF